MSKFFQSMRGRMVGASLCAALVMGGAVGSPTGPLGPRTAHAAVSSFDKYLSQVKGEIYRDYVRVTSYTITSKGPSKAYISFTQVGSYSQNGRKYTVTKTWEAVVSPGSYYTRNISTSVK